MSIHQDDRRQLECVIADLTKELEAKDKALKTAKLIIGKQNSELDAKDKLLAEYRELLLAVSSSTFDGFLFRDVSGGNWWDAREKLLTNK